MNAPQADSAANVFDECSGIVVECIEAALDMSADEIAELLEALPRGLSQFGDDGGWCFGTSGDDCWRAAFGDVWRDDRTPAKGTSLEWDAAMREAARLDREEEIDEEIRLLYARRSYG